jgi:hypothetical protein
MRLGMIGYGTIGREGGGLASQDGGPDLRGDMVLRPASPFTWMRDLGFPALRGRP